MSAHDPGPGEEPVDDASTNLEFGRLGKHRTPCIHGVRFGTGGRLGNKLSRPAGRKAFGQAVTEGMMVMNEGGCGPAERGAGIVVFITVTA